MLLVEGQTEEQFVKQVLGPFVWENNTTRLIPIIVKTKQVAGSDPAHKGGYVTFVKLKMQIDKLLGDTSTHLVSTMLDYFRIGDDYPGVRSNPGKNNIERAIHVETKITEEVNNNRFKAYLQIHEFESLLFSRTSAIADKFAVCGRPEHSRMLNALDEAWKSYKTPEEINTGALTHPFARIKGAISSYKKMIDGPQIARTIGIPAIQKRCDHFRSWVSLLTT